MSEILDEDAILTALEDLPGWRYDDNALQKTFAFTDFQAALAFMNAVGAEADVLNHHPDWTNVYNKVSVRLTTHDADSRVTAKDIQLAEVMERCVSR